MAATNPQLLTIEIGDAPEAWRAAGFDVDESGALALGSTTLVMSDPTRQGLADEGPRGVLGWALEGLDGPAAEIDGLRSCPTAHRDPVGHPNGITRIDHVVVRSGDPSRTVAAFDSAGFELRGERRTSSYGSPMRQCFFWAGDVIVELIGPDEGEPTLDDPTSFFGLALVADDLDGTVEWFGERISGPKDAVQPGRRIAGVRGRELGLSVPLAVMSPHPG